MRSEMLECCKGKMSLMNVKMYSQGLEMELRCTTYGKHKIVNSKFTIIDNKIKTMKVNYWKTA